MPKVSKECLDEAFYALKNFTRDDLDGYVREVFSRARSYDNLMNMNAFEKSMIEINDNMLKSFFEDASNKAKNIYKYDSNVKLIEKGHNIRSLLTKRYNNLGDNVASAQKSAQGRLEMFFFRELSFEETEFFSSAKNDELIADAYDGKKIENKFANSIADKLKKYFDYRNSELIISSAMKFDEINEDRMFRQIHDSGRLISGGKSLMNSAKDFFMKKYTISESKIKWVNFIKQHLDMEKTFKYTKATEIYGKINESEANKILNNIFDNITTGKSEIFTKSVVANDRKSIERKSRMFFKFKDMRSFLEYNKVYGKGNLFGALRSDIQGSGSKTGMAELWGDSPYNMYNDLRKIDTEKNNKGSFWWNNTDKYFKTVMGLDKSPISATVANMSANLRMMTSMARLMKISIQSVSDIGYAAAFAHRIGLNYFSSWSYLLKNIFDKYPHEERAHIAKLYKLMIHSHLGFIGRWTDANNTTEFMNKISTKYFKTIGLEAFDRGNKVSIMHLMSKSLFNNSNKSFDGLNSGLNKWVSKFLNKDEWDLLRGKNNNGLFTTDNVDNLSDDELKSYQQKIGSETPLYQLRNDLFRRVYSMFDVASENAVMSPTEFERAWCFQGKAPGSVTGELLRTVSQFKMYTMAYIDRVLVNGFKDADTMQKKLSWGISMFIGTLPLSIASVWLDNLSSGLTMPDYSMMNIPQREQYLMSMIMPSLAIFQGIVDPNNQNSSMFWSLIGSPTSRLIGNSMASASALLAGNPKKAGKELSDALNYVLPIQTTPFISPFVRETLGEQAHIQPGQSHIFGQ